MDQTKSAGGERRKFAKGATIFKEGDLADAAYIVESGKVEIFKTVSGRQVVIGTVSQWGIFGELGVMDDNPRMAGAVALEDTSCLVVQAENVLRMLDGAPQGLTVILNSMAQIIRQSGNDLAQARFELERLHRIE